MKIPQEIIEKAISGGWKPLGETVYNSIEYREGDIGFKGLQNLANQVALYPYPAIALDSEFWIALGKALGWKSYGTTQGWDWDKNAHRFYDLILNKQPTEAFWEELLAGNK